MNDTDSNYLLHNLHCSGESPVITSKVVKLGRHSTIAIEIAKPLDEISKMAYTLKIQSSQVGNYPLLRILE